MTDPIFSSHARADELQRLVVEAAPNAMLMIDRGRRIVLVNRAAEHLFGYSRSELVGERIELLVPQRYRAEHPAHVEGFHAQPKARAMGAGRELFGQRKDGTEVPIEIGLNPIATSDGLFTLASIIDITERQKAQERFRLVVEAAPNAMLMIDLEQRITLVNRRTEDLFGYHRGELLGKPIDMLVPQRYRDNHPMHVKGFQGSPKARAMGGGRDLFGRRKDGTEVPVEIGLNPIETPDGFSTLASIIDVTERKRAEERFRLVVEAAPNAMLMIDKCRRITLVNQRTEDLFGYDRTDLLGQPIELLVPQRFREEHPAHVGAFFSAPRARAMGAGRELFGRRQDGTEVPIEIGLNPIETPEGLFTLASIIDISERRRAEAAHERLAAIVEYSDDAIISKAPDGTIVSWNHGAEQLFGYAAEEALGQPVFMLVPDRLRNEEGKLLDQIQRDERLNHFETIRRRKDGSELDVSVRLSPIKNNAGEVIGESSIMRDITELKRRDTELQRSNAELEQFAYVASHDLQEPLRMVANYTELLAQRYRGKLDEKADKYIHYASDGARRMQRLVADLLEYSRVGSQGKSLLPVDANAVLVSVLDSLQALIGGANATVEHGALPLVLADEVQLRQVFQNLISNAIKFRSAAAPHVTVKATAASGRWLFSVADNGIGLDMKHAARIFQMFQRLHELGRYEGSGIGLAIAKRIVERHGGSIWVESQIGAGTTFCFSLKCVPKSES
jgi:PAS domain S-box-containing protein